jgi:hypothetical protein
MNNRSLEISTGHIHSWNVETGSVEINETMFQALDLIFVMPF